MDIKLVCERCNVIYTVPHWREKTSKYCSRECKDNSSKGALNCKCDECGSEFHLKESAKKRYNRTMGYFCSIKCSTKFKKDFYKGKNNPNYRGKQYDDEGYRINHYPKIGRMKEHVFVTLDFLGLKERPNNLVIHHRDCNIYNNIPDNLVLLSASDHRWVHNQFGNATLWAFYHKKIDLDSLIKWSNDPEKTKRILPLSIIKQKEQKIFKKNKDD